MESRMKKSNIGSTFESWLREEGIREEVDAKVLERVVARLDKSALAQKGLTEPTVPRTCKSRALAALHENVRDLHRLGLIDEKAMRKFDAACLAPARKPARTAPK